MMPDKNESIQNKTLVQFFEWYCPTDGQHWNRFKDEVPNLLSMGVTAVWLPPPYKGTRGECSEGYDVYDIYDLGEFYQKETIRTKYGTKQEYINAVQFARNAGLKVYADIVLNHMGGAEEKERIKVRRVDPDNRLHFTSEPMEIEAYTKFTFPGRNGRHSDFKWDYNCFTGIDFAADRNEKAIFSILNDYGESWEPLAHNEKGNFDYLILNDIEMRNPAVRRELKNWIRWFYNTAPFDGLRLDAVKHINPDFFIEWIDFVKAEIRPDMYVLGEYWLSDDLPVLLKYIDVTGGRMSLFDAPLHHNFSIASNLREKYDLRNIFKETLIAEKPSLAVTFVDNHDTQPLQSLEEYTEQWFKPHAYALILLREAGYPCIFYPDIYGTVYSGKNKQQEDCSIDIPQLHCLPSLLKLRKDYSYGKQVDYFDDPYSIGWTRQGHSLKPGSGCAVLLTNHPSLMAVKEMEVGEHFAGMEFYDYLGNHKGKVIIDENGKGNFFANPASVSVWVPWEG